MNATPTAISFPGSPKIVLITQSPWDAAMAVDLSGNVWIWGPTFPGNGTYTYDPAHPGDLIKVTDPDANVTQYAYDTSGNRVKEIDPLADATTHVYDIVGRESSAVSPNGNVTGGNPSRYTTTYTVNGFGDILTVTDPLGQVTTHTYDRNRNLTAVKDALMHTTTYTYDADNRRTQVTRADTSILTTSYDSYGNVTSQTDGLNTVRVPHRTLEPSIRNADIERLPSA